MLLLTDNNVQNPEGLIEVVKSTWDLKIQTTVVMFFVDRGSSAYTISDYADIVFFVSLNDWLTKKEKIFVFFHNESVYFCSVTA